MRIVILPGGKAPKYGTPNSAGFDVSSRITTRIKPGERKLIPVGLIFELPEGLEAQVRPRSGLAVNHGITVLNTPGTIDSDYRGEVAAILINHSTEDFIIKIGDRIAQIVIAKYEQPNFEETTLEELTKTVRSDGGFGHTGI